jgi:hypothetical protein
MYNPDFKMMIFKMFALHIRAKILLFLNNFVNDALMIVDFFPPQKTFKS